MPGYIKLDLLREVEAPAHYQMVIRFETQDAAKNWRDSEIHAALKPALKVLHTNSTLQVYDVVS